jgi:hypothetical protein
VTSIVQAVAAVFVIGALRTPDVQAWLAQVKAREEQGASSGSTTE